MDIIFLSGCLSRIGGQCFIYKLPQSMFGVKDKQQNEMQFYEKKNTI